MTEDEAKIKTCCGPEGAGYTNDQVFRARYCVASACMAWRWSFSSRAAKSAAEAAPLSHRDRPFVATGYCGLAGSPS